MNNNSKFAIFAAAALVATLIADLRLFPAAAVAADQAPHSLQVSNFEPPAKSTKALEPARNVPRVHAVPTRPGLQMWIVQFEAEPLATFSGGTPAGATRHLAPTQPRARGERRLDPRSAASRSYLDFLASRQALQLAEIRSALARAPEVRHSYRAAFNGMAMQLTTDEAARVAKLQGVKSVRPEVYRYIETDRGPTFIGADQVWSGEFGNGAGTRGAGVVVAILDTGLNMRSGHPSFAELGGDGYQVVNPLGAGNYRGRCNPADPNYDATLQCNGKVVGAYSFTADDTPEDEDGHGSHVAATAAGNVVNSVEIPNTTLTVDVSGVAPHANIMIYDVCITTGGCPISAILAALDQVALDADIVDVLNYSIGGASSDPWSDADSLGFLALREAGIFVATSAGNSGPGAATVGSPADAPWITTVANQTHDRIVADTALSVTGPGTVPPELIDILVLQGTGPGLAADIAAAIGFDATNATGCGPFGSGAFTGEIALIARGGCTFATKVNNASAAGALAVIVYNNIIGAPAISMGGLDSTTIPAGMITNADGIAVRDWITGNVGATALFDQGFDTIFLDPVAGDRMNSSSSRGPNPATGDILKPDISAPGTNIFAAFQGSGDAWSFLSGTSMASPHVAGSAALVRALHPGWTAAEIHSALVMRAPAADSIVKENGVTPSDPFDRGAGRVSPPGAASALLVMDETAADFDTANPGAGGDPTQLNLPHLADSKCVSTCSWTRTFRMVDDAILPAGSPSSTTWSIDFDAPAGTTFAATPSTFVLNAGDTREVTFTADLSSAPFDEWMFGFVNLTLDGFSASAGGTTRADVAVPYQRLPISVLSVMANLPEPAVIETRRDAGSRIFEGLESTEIVDLNIQSSGLVPATETAISLAQDPTRGNPFDDLGQVFTKTVTVPAGAQTLVAETASVESPDVDLFVVDLGTSTTVCASAAAGSNERCEIEEPVAGDYLLIVQNWQGSASQPDRITLFDVIVPAISGNNASLSAQGPSGSVSAGIPWDLRVFFELDAEQTATRWFGALELSSDSKQQGDIGVIPVELARLGDDVVKLADRNEATVGEIIEYTLFVDTNQTGQTQSYQIVDQLPNGLALIPGSIQFDRGAVNDGGGQIEWTFNLAPPAFGYEITTSADDMSCDTPFGGYVNLQDFGISPADIGSPPDSPLDTVLFTAFTEGNPIDLYGVAHAGMSFSDDGFVLGDFAANYGGDPWAPQTVPDAALPNNLVAGLWQDMEIVNDPANFKGLSLAVEGEELIIIEYDDVQPFGGDGSVTWDFEIIMRRAADDTPGAFEIMVAYDNLSPLLDPITIGVENAAGDMATALVNNTVPGAAIANGTVVCFNRVAEGTAQLSYQAEVVGEPASADGYFSNEAVHSTSELGSRQETAIGRVKYSDVIFEDGFEPSD